MRTGWRRYWSLAVSNLTSSFVGSNSAACDRATYGVSIAVSQPGSSRVITFSLSGAWPQGTVYLGLPSFRSAGVSSVEGGTYDAATNSVTVTPGTTRVVVTLGS